MEVLKETRRRNSPGAHHSRQRRFFSVPALSRLKVFTRDSSSCFLIRTNNIIQQHSLFTYEIHSAPQLLCSFNIVTRVVDGWMDGWIFVEFKHPTLTVEINVFHLTNCINLCNPIGMRIGNIWSRRTPSQVSGVVCWRSVNAGLDCMD